MGVAVLISGVISLTVTPMLASVMLRQQHSHSALFNWSERLFDSIRDGYASSLRWMLGYQGLVLLASVGAGFTVGAVLLRWAF